MERPNILIVMTDHQRHDTVLSEGPVIAPNFNKFAAFDPANTQLPEVFVFQKTLGNTSHESPDLHRQAYSNINIYSPSSVGIGLFFVERCFLYPVSNF